MCVRTYIICSHMYARVNHTYLILWFVFQSDFTDIAPYQLQLEVNDIIRSIDGQQSISDLSSFPRIRVEQTTTAMVSHNYVRTYVCICVYVDMYVRVCMHAWMYVSVLCVYVCTCAFMCVCVRMYVCLYICMFYAFLCRWTHVVMMDVGVKWSSPWIHVLCKWKFLAEQTRHDITVYVEIPTRGC